MKPRLKTDQLRRGLTASGAHYQMRRDRDCFGVFKPALDKRADRILVQVGVRRMRQYCGRNAGFETLIDQMANRLALFFFFFHHHFRQEAPSICRVSALSSMNVSLSRARVSSCTLWAGSSAARTLQISISAAFRPCLSANSSWKRLETFWYTFSSQRITVDSCTRPDESLRRFDCRWNQRLIGDRGSSTIRAISLSLRPATG